MPTTRHAAAVFALILSCAAGPSAAQGVSGVPCNDAGIYVCTANGALYRGVNNVWSLVNGAPGHVVGLTTATGECAEIWAITDAGTLVEGAFQGRVFASIGNIFQATGRPASQVVAFGTNATNTLYAVAASGDVFGFNVVSRATSYIGTLSGIPTATLPRSWGSVKARYR
jgi:hypothetical protein